MSRLIKLIVVVLVFEFLSGCTTAPRISLGEVESDGALAGSIGRTICQVAINEHQENGEWPDALRLARLGGLSTHNRAYNENYAVYILNKPYNAIPAQMDSTQTFAFYGYYSPADSSYYTYCRWYYRHGPGKMVLSSSEGDKAAVHGMKLVAEQILIDFLFEARKANTASDFDGIVKRHALDVSETSPNPTAKQILFEFTHDLLENYYNTVVNLNSDSLTFFEKFDQYSLRLGKFIFRQDWTQH